MHRRTFLTYSCLAGAATLSATNVKIWSSSTEEAIYNIIIHEFGYLNLDKAGIEAFVKDYLKEDTYTSYLRIKVKYYSLLEVDSNQSKVVKSIANRYIFSTDFFTNGMDTNKPVKYRGLYDPYKSPCANPFSSMYYSDETT